MCDAKSDCEKLLGAMMPFAEQLLREYGEFFPFGVSMSQKGDITMEAVSDSDEHPPAEKLISLVKERFRAGAQSGKLKATGLAYDALTLPPGKQSKQNTVICALDHRDNYSIQVCFPYERDQSSHLAIGPPFAVAGKQEIFSK